MDDILDEHIIPEEERNYPIADKGLRFANYMVDYICFTPLTMLIMGFTNLMTGNDYLAENDNLFINYLIGATSIILYYTITEYYFKGKTIGKLITKTRAVTLENHPMDFNTALKRSVSRIVPFEALSFLGNMSTGWHDRWTDTKVIKDNGWKEEF